MFDSKKNLTGVLLITSFVISGAAWGEIPEVIGTFGVTPVETHSAMAIWVPVTEGSSIEGVTWFNNDESVVFPEILAVAGEYGHPELLELATTVATHVSGGSAQWSESLFSQPVTSTSSGLYLILRLPEGTEFEFEGSGGGSGIGFFDGGRINNCWITGDGVDWFSLVPDYQMALLPITSGDKSNNLGNTLVLSPPDTEGEIHGEFHLDSYQGEMAVYPNPFNPSTQVKFVLESACQVDLKVFDTRGRLVKSLMQGVQPAGRYFAEWHGRNDSGQAVPSGVYFMRLIAGNKTKTSRCTMLK